MLLPAAVRSKADMSSIHCNTRKAGADNTVSNLVVCKLLNKSLSCGITIVKTDCVSQLHGIVWLGSVRTVADRFPQEDLLQRMI